MHEASEAGLSGRGRLGRSAAIRIGVVDHQKLRRELLLAFLGSQKGVTAIGGFARGAEAVRAARTLAPDVLLASSVLPDMSGGQLAEQVRAVSPKTKTVILCEQFDGDWRRLARAGDVQIVRPESCSLRTLLATIQESRLAISSAPTAAESDRERRGSPAEVSILSPREGQILKLVGAGESNREIAEILGISVRTVEVHKNNIKIKLSLRRSYDLTVAAIGVANAG